MLILSLDTSTLVGSTAITRDDDIVAESCINVQRTHAERLLPAIKRMLEECGLSFSQIDAVAVTEGPGSFTGLRIGMATAKGICFAADKPIVGISTLAALAQNLAFARHPVCPVLDAKKKQVYCGLYRDPGDGLLRMEWSERAASPEELVRRITETTIFLGDGMRKYGSMLSKALGPKALFAPANYHVVRASNVGRLARRRLRNGETDDLFTLTPRYLRRSDAEIARDDRQEQKS